MLGFWTLILALNALITVSNGIKPLVLSAHEGDRVFLPCFNNPEEKINLWKINGTLYAVEELPVERLHLHKNNYGIFISHTTMNVTGNVTCYTYNGNSLKVISTVNFVVHERDQAQTATSYTEEQGKRKEISLRVTRSDTIFIPCVPTLGTSNISIWGIDGSLYPCFELPTQHIHQKSGLIATNVSESTGISYKCYMVTNSTIQEQFKIKLIFNDPETVGSGVQSPARTNEGEKQLKLVSSGVCLRRDDKYAFEFRIVNDTQNNYCKPGNVSFTMNVTDGTQSLWSNDTDKYLPKFSPPKEFFEEKNAYAEVYSTPTSSDQKCAELKHRIKVEIDGNITFADCDKDVCCVSEGSRSCVTLPDNINGMVVIWPRTPHSELDCACAVFYASPEVPDETFEDCYCLSQRLTVYNVTLNEIKKQLCWNGLTNATNDTRVVFVRDTGIDYSVRTFQSESRIIVEGKDLFPPRFTPELNGTTACINSTKPVSSPVIGTAILVYDNTDDLISNYTEPSSDFCLVLQFFPKTCAPFTVNATAITQCSHSTTVMYTSNITQNSSTCECLSDKVKLNFTSQVSSPSSIELLFNTSCFSSHLFDLDNITNLYLEAVETSCTENCTTRTSFSIQCDQNSTSVTADGLKDDTPYNLSVVWVSNSSETCVIYYQLLTRTSMATYKLILAFGIPIAIIVVIVVLITAYFLYKRREKRRQNLDVRVRNYNPIKGVDSATPGVQIKD